MKASTSINLCLVCGIIVAAIMGVSEGAPEIFGLDEALENHDESDWLGDHEIGPDRHERKLPISDETSLGTPELWEMISKKQVWVRKSLENFKQGDKAVRLNQPK